MKNRLDRWISVKIRHEIERRFYAPINEQATLSRLVHDSDFMAAPHRHVGLFADHGVVHARDVATQILDVLATCHGVLIPERNPERFARMLGFGVLVAYLHDIGMIDFSEFGRSMHPEFAAQAVFDPAFDDLIDTVWLEDSGGLVTHLRSLAQRGLIYQDPKLVLRELLSLSLCHSKSKVPMTTLNDPALLRAMLIHTVTTDRHALFTEQRLRKHRPHSGGLALHAAPEQMNGQIARFAHLFPDEAYSWLVDDNPEVAQLVEDAIDTVRALRVADALRQRGTVLETSGHYQVFVDQRNGNAIYALRLGRDRLYLLEVADPISAGEANIASSELERTGDLRISFHRGSFSAPGGQKYAAQSAARVILDIQRDAIESFRRVPALACLKEAAEMAILLEEPEDDRAFSQMVHDEIAQVDPMVARSVRSVPTLADSYPQERAHYLAAEPIVWEPNIRSELLANLGLSGYPIERIDLESAFESVRLLTLRAGDTLIDAGTQSSSVYLPMGPGLTIIPLGGYFSFPAEPWQLLGTTGVIRGSERSATIVADRDVQTLLIPSSAYFTYWHHTLSLEEFQRTIAQALAESPDLTGPCS